MRRASMGDMARSIRGSLAVVGSKFTPKQSQKPRAKSLGIGGVKKKRAGSIAETKVGPEVEVKPKVILKEKPFKKDPKEPHVKVVLNFPGLIGPEELVFPWLIKARLAYSRDGDNIDMTSIDGVFKKFMYIWSSCKYQLLSNNGAHQSCGQAFKLSGLQVAEPQILSDGAEVFYENYVATEQIGVFARGVLMEESYLSPLSSLLVDALSIPNRVKIFFEKSNSNSDLLGIDDVIERCNRLTNKIQRNSYPVFEKGVVLQGEPCGQKRSVKEIITSSLGLDNGVRSRIRFVDIDVDPSLLDLSRGVVADADYVFTPKPNRGKGELLSKVIKVSGSEGELLSWYVLLKFISNINHGGYDNFADFIKAFNKLFYVLGMPHERLSSIVYASLVGDGDSSVFGISDASIFTISPMVLARHRLRSGFGLSAPALHDAVLKGDRDALQACLNQRRSRGDAGVNSVDVDGRTVLMKAVLAKGRKAVPFLDSSIGSLIACSNLDINKVDKLGNSVFMCAVGTSLMHKFFMLSGIDVGVINNHGNTALLKAVQCQDFKCVGLLLGHNDFLAPDADAGAGDDADTVTMLNMANFESKTAFVLALEVLCGFFGRSGRGGDNIMSSGFGVALDITRQLVEAQAQVDWKMVVSDCKPGDILNLMVCMVAFINSCSQFVDVQEALLGIFKYFYKSLQDFMRTVSDAETQQELQCIFRKHLALNTGLQVAKGSGLLK